MDPGKLGERDCCYDILSTLMRELIHHHFDFFHQELSKLLKYSGSLQVSWEEELRA